MNKLGLGDSKVNQRQGDGQSQLTVHQARTLYGSQADTIASTAHTEQQDNVDVAAGATTCGNDALWAAALSLPSFLSR